MKSFTGKSSSARRWVLLIALLFGAGVMVSACGDEEIPTPTTPEPPPPPDPPPPPPPDPPAPTGPATPENLRVSNRTTSSLTWSWDAVEGALGYQGQFSTDASFTAADPTFIVVAPATSHTVANLSGNMAGHFRVRSGTGTAITDLTYSDWSESVMGTTAAPPPAAALAAPDNFESSDPEHTSIVLTWDEVDDAETYEVEQRVNGSSAWDEASCDDASGNVVEDNQCIATGLSEGTDYDFRVRGLPAADDEAHAAGGWATTDGTTTGRVVITNPGGMGDLNVTWESTGTGITWTWDPMAGADYEWTVVNGPATTRNPCEDVVFDVDNGSGKQFSHTEEFVAGEVKGLCVRVRTEDGANDNPVSFAWGTTTPEAVVVGEASRQDGVTTALEWTDFSLKGGFDYEVRLVADSERAKDIKEDTPVKTIQAACAAGIFVDQGESDIDTMLDEVVVSRGLTPYTGYLLCYRLANTVGATSWAVPMDNKEHVTNPARPPSPRLDSARTTRDATTESVVWSLAVRPASTNVPREAGMFEARLIEYDEAFKGDGEYTNGQPATCDKSDIEVPSSDASTNAMWKIRSIGDEEIKTDNQGITVSSGEITRNSSDGTLGDTRIRVCVRAKSGGDEGGQGPWVVSAVHEVRRQATSN